MAEIWFHPDAEADYESALAWYFLRSARAAAGFETSVERAINFLQSFPEACPLRDGVHRHCALRRYPYGLIYRVREGAVQVMAVAHDHQLPDFWMDRD